MRRNLWLAGLLLLAVACVREPGVTPGDGDSDPVAASRDPVMSMERLQELALELPADFSEGLSTRSARKMIREVVPVTDFIDASLIASATAANTQTRATRAGGVATGVSGTGSAASPRPSEADVATTLGRIYVVNYEEDAGFAILSADRQLPSVLGYADSGNITDTMSNPGVKLLLERLPDYVQNALIWDSLTDPDPPVDPNPGGGGGTDPAPDPSDTTAVYRYHHNGMERGTTTGPYVQVRWDQWAPFNDYAPDCPNNYTRHAPAGCVAIAMLQIMSYHQYPTSYLSVTTSLEIALNLNWSVLNASKTRDEMQNNPEKARIAGFVRRIGEDVDMGYTCDAGSGSNIDKANQVLKDYGYQTGGIQNYDWSSTRSDLRQARPVYVRGVSVNGGHAWVVDGYMAARIPVDVFMDVYDSNGNFLRGYYLGIEYEYQDLMHCNWGWNGGGNGYFYEGIFVPKQPVYSDGTGSNGNNQFTTDLQIIKNIRR